MATNIDDHLNSLKDAYEKNDLTFYLGAGVSIPNGLPSWDKLVLSMYFSSNKRIFKYGHIRPFPNYLFAISEWIMKEKNEPLDILVRKLKRNVSEDHFMKLLVETLYAGYYTESIEDIHLTPNDILDANPTLKSIVEICNEREKGVKAIITYNYDNLLELGLNEIHGAQNHYKPIFKSDDELHDKLPIYHVHGYIPVPGTDVEQSKYEHIILSEESYHRAAQDAYYWGNMVQMQHLSNSTGVMIGMSLSDRNIRRILDSLRSTPIKTNNYLITKKPRRKNLESPDHDFVRRKAEEYMSKFERSGRKAPQMKTDFTIQKITDIISDNEIENFAEEFSDLGLELIWFDEFDELPEILSKIRS